MLLGSAAELGRARSIGQVRQIVTGMAGSLFGPEVTIDISSEPGQALSVPLVGSDRSPLGYLRAGGRAFSAEDEEILAQLARLAAARLESLHLFEREHRLAATLQDSIIPARLPELPGLMLAAHYSPGNPEAEVGGDWYDALALPGGFLAIATGDVVGRGVHAAAIMGQLRNAFRAFLLEGYMPADALGRLNGLVNTLGDAYFCTVVCCLIDPARGFARVASAGHAPPIVVTADGAVRFQDLVPSIAIGAVEEVVYSDTALMLHPGDSLLLYTDGLVERRGRSLDDGLDRLFDAASATGGDPALLVDHVVSRMMEAGEGEDDVAAIAVTVLPALTERLKLRLPALPVSVAALRRRLRTWLRALGLGDDEIFDVVLAVSEAAANAIEHAADPTSPSIVVSVTPVDGRAVLSVEDFGRWKETPPDEDRGRGLRIIEALVETPSIERSSRGTTVTFRAVLPRRPMP
jgi:serine phosphatase RsbU (regulator of sigma subunit)/anti-sigma regulatory factor (Ser/Thr protein kinase)